MTKSEVKEMLVKIERVFPRYSPSDKKGILDAWYELFKDEKAEQMFKNLNAVLKEKSYPPVPADIISYQWPVELKIDKYGGMQL